MKTNKYLFTIIIFTFYCLNILPQIYDKPFVVNSIIGDTLNIFERDNYLLFPKIKDFNWAVFYLKPDSMLDAQVNFSSNGLIKDTLIENYKKLKSLAYHIWAKDALDHGTFENTYNENNYDVGSGKGIEIKIIKKTGEEKFGELLSVRKNSLILYNPGCNDNIIINDCVWKENKSDIDKLVIEGKSNLGLGIGLGLAASVVSSIIIYKSYYDRSETAFLRGIDAFESSIGTIIITIAGLTALGAIIGSETSTPDKEINIIDDENIYGLSQYSRYPEQEPPQLQAME